MLISNSVDKAVSEHLQQRKLKIEIQKEKEREVERQKRKREHSLDKTPQSELSIMSTSHCEFHSDFVVDVGDIHEVEYDLK